MRSWDGPTNSAPNSVTTPGATLALRVRPPTRSRASSTMTSRPERAMFRAAVRPASPAPTMQTSAVRRRRRRWAAAVIGRAAVAAMPAAPATKRRRVSVRFTGGET
jgi:hypothetical protein